MRLRDSAIDAADEPARVLTPMRCAQACQRRDEHHASRVRRLLRQRFDVLRFREQTQPVAQPLHRRAGDERASFESVCDFVSDLPRDRPQQAVARRRRFAARVHEQERSRAVGALRLSLGEARLSDERRLLIARDSGDRQAIGKPAHTLHRSEHARRGPDLRQHAARYSEQLAQLVVPLAAREIHQQRTRGVGHVGRVHRSARELPQERAIARTCHLLAALHCRRARRLEPMPDCGQPTSAWGTFSKAYPSRTVILPKYPIDARRCKCGGCWRIA